MITNFLIAACGVLFGIFLSRTPVSLISRGNRPAILCLTGMLTSITTAMLLGKGMTDTAILKWFIPAAVASLSIDLIVACNQSLKKTLKQVDAKAEID